MAEPSAVFVKFQQREGGSLSVRPKAPTLEAHLLVQPPSKRIKISCNG